MCPSKFCNHISFLTYSVHSVFLKKKSKTKTKIGVFRAHFLRLIFIGRTVCHPSQNANRIRGLPKFNCFLPLDVKFQYRKDLYASLNTWSRTYAYQFNNDMICSSLQSFFIRTVLNSFLNAHLLWHTQYAGKFK